LLGKGLIVDGEQQIIEQAAYAYMRAGHCKDDTQAMLIAHITAMIMRDKSPKEIIKSLDVALRTWEAILNILQRTKT
jgi:hypothetical protein